MRAGWGIAIAAWIAALAGCAATLPPVPGKGGPAWFELTSEHFTMWTDAEPGRARELLDVMERLRQIIVGVAFPSVPANSKVLVIAFRDDAELARFTPTGEARAFARPASPPLWQPVVLVSAFSNRMSEQETLTHELTHAISYSAVRRQPRWLAEGMAQYFETLQLDGRRTTVDVGVAPMNRGQRRQMPHLVPITTLFGWEGTHEIAVEQRLYSTGWALFTFLINKHRSELARYLELLDGSDGPPKETGPQRALRVWPEAIPSLPLGVVDEELRQWLVSGNHVILHFNVQAQKWPTTEHALGDADVHAMRALLLAAARREAEARSSLQAALATEPIHVLARLVGLAYFKVAVSPAEGRAAVAAHPDDWRAWYLDAIALSRAEGESPEELAAEVRICELIAQNRAVVAPVTTCVDGQRRTASP